MDCMGGLKLVVDTQDLRFPVLLPGALAGSGVVGLFSGKGRLASFWRGALGAGRRRGEGAFFGHPMLNSAMGEPVLSMHFFFI